jgi:hypothetical protein
MVLHQAFFGDGFLQLIPPKLNVEIGRINDLQAHLGGKGIGTLAHQHHMRAFHHYGVRSSDGVAYCRNRGNRTCHARGTIHDRRIQFNAAGITEHRALAGIE